MITKEEVSWGITLAETTGMRPDGLPAGGWVDAGPAPEEGICAGCGERPPAADLGGLCAACNPRPWVPAPPEPEKQAYDAGE